MADETKYISSVQIGADLYEIKDSVAREMIAKGIQFVISSDAATTPAGVKWTKPDGTEVTGTLEPSATEAGKIYLVLISGADPKAVYAEYISVKISEASEEYMWERLGDTAVAVKNLVKDVNYTGGTKTPGIGDVVLGVDTTFTAPSVSVHFTNQTDDTFVKSYPGVKSKLVKDSIRGVSGEQSVTGIASNTAVTASKATAAANAGASKIVTIEKTATQVTFGTNTTASKATQGTAFSAAGVGTDVTVNGINSDSTIDDLVYGMKVTGETLSFSTVGTVSKTATKAGTAVSIQPYTFSDVTVPVVSASENITFDAVESNDDVTITQWTFEDVDASKVVSATAFNAATADTTSKSFATGALATTGTGAEIMTGLGQASTASAITAVGNGMTRSAEVIVGAEDQIKIAKYDDLTLSVTKNN